jgi:hypothetical protein
MPVSYPNTPPVIVTITRELKPLVLTETKSRSALASKPLLCLPTSLSRFGTTTEDALDATGLRRGHAALLGTTYIEGLPSPVISLLVEDADVIAGAHRDVRRVHDAVGIRRWVPLSEWLSQSNAPAFARSCCKVVMMVLCDRMNSDLHRDLSGVASPPSGEVDLLRVLGGVRSAIDGADSLCGHLADTGTVIERSERGVLFASLRASIEPVALTTWGTYLGPAELGNKLVAATAMPVLLGSEIDSPIGAYASVHGGGQKIVSRYYAWRDGWELCAWTEGDRVLEGSPEASLFPAGHVLSCDDAKTCAREYRRATR